MTESTTTSTDTSSGASTDQSAGPDRTPLYALAGVADAAVETLRELPGRVAETVGDEKFRTEVRERFAHLPDDAKALREEFPDRLKGAQTKAGELAAELPGRIRELVEQASREASRVYGELAELGEGAVAR